MSRITSASKLLFRQLFDPESSTYTYLIACPRTREAVIVDSVYEQVERDVQQIERLGVHLKAILDTHVHADHISGAIGLHHRLKLPSNVPIIHGHNSGVILREEHVQDGIQVDFVKDLDKIQFGDRYLTVRETPGHTDHHLSFVMDDESFVLTGCSLYIGNCGRTDFQGGSSEQMYHSIKDKLYTLPDDCVLYPGHNYHGCLSSTIGEEKKFNHRIPESQTLDGFVNLMNNLKLPHPKKIHISVPANIVGGWPAASIVQQDGDSA